jgi:hypothetical protein
LQCKLGAHSDLFCQQRDSHTYLIFNLFILDIDAKPAFYFSNLSRKLDTFLDSAHNLYCHATHLVTQYVEIFMCIIH